ncbi:MAG TPA: type II secretion system F family protein [Candidatus Saccharimonadales bacterium]|nr:type II secretion system F family protein [Candidatus Saccharimonadales bacterium]
MKLPRLESKIDNTRLKDSETQILFESLSTMLSSGIPILDALNTIIEDSNNKNTKVVITQISESINSGKSLAESFGMFPETFDSVFLNIVKSGEASGTLDKVLFSASENLKENIETKNNIKSALFYPLIILSVLTLVTFFVFGYSLPKVAKVFFDLHLNLPSYSSAILHFSVWIGLYKIYLLSLIAVFIILFYLLLKLKPFKHFLLKILFSLPIVSRIANLADLTRFTQTTGLLLNAGVPIIDALEISKEVVFSQSLKNDIGSVRESISKGLTLEKAMKDHPKSFPSLLRRVVGVGEEAGNLGEQLSKIAKNYQKKFSDTIKNLTVIIEPILIILIAVLVALVLVSVVLPIYQGIGSINRH